MPYLLVPSSSSSGMQARPNIARVDHYPLQFMFSYKLFYRILPNAFHHRQNRRSTSRVILPNLAGSLAPEVNDKILQDEKNRLYNEASKQYENRKNTRIRSANEHIREKNTKSQSKIYQSNLDFHEQYIIENEKYLKNLMKGQIALNHASETHQKQQ